MECGGARWVDAASHSRCGPLQRFDGIVNRRSFSLELILGALLFLALTLSVFTYQFSRMGDGEGIFSWDRLQFEYLWLLLLCLPFDSVASALRIWLVSRILHPAVSFWTCLRAEWANVGVAMLTPSQTGGGIGQIYVLHRSGVGIPSAMIISLITFLGTMIGLLCVGFYSALICGVPLRSCSSMAVWPLTVILGSMGVPLLWPGLFRGAVLQTLRGLSALCRLGDRVLSRPPRAPDIPLPRLQRLGARLIELVFQYHRDTWRFIREGRLHFAAVCLLSIEFILARSLMAFLCLRFLGIEASSLGEVVEIQMALQFLLYFAPTPGSSGVAELLSLSAMSAIIPSELGPYYNLLWRTSTLYLPAVLGLVLLSLSLLRDTGRVFGRSQQSREEETKCR